MSEELNDQNPSEESRLPTQLELDLLFLYYNFADQNGVVDIKRAQLWAFNKLGVLIDDTPLTLQQQHIDLLMDAGMVPDLREVLARVALPRSTE